MEMLTNLTLLRPWWLLLLVLIPLWWIAARYVPQSDGGWGRVIPRPILASLQRGTDAAQRPPPRWSVIALIMVMALALSGPSLRYSEQPLHQYQDNLVVVLDVSLSMLVEDIPPNRLTQAKRRIRDILAMREGAETALVAYAGDAHVVSPLTRDARVIESFLPALDPFMMPAYGGRADLGVARAVELLEQAGRGPGRILLITDGIRDHWHEPLLQHLSETEHSLDILATGTAEGGPIPLEDRGHLREDGETVIVRAELEPLQSLASAAAGRAVRATPGDRDLEALDLAATRGHATEQSSATALKRVDEGVWLAFLIIPLLLVTRRHGHLSALIIAATLAGWHPPAQASLWSALWLTPDQRGARALEQDPAKAAEHFEDADWAATASYRAGQYQQAAELWGMLDSARARYNRGNALAFAGELQAAIEAYEQALERDPDFTEARNNRRRLLELMQEQTRGQSPEGEPQADPASEPSRDPAPEGEAAPDTDAERGRDDSADAPEPAETGTAPQTERAQPSVSWDEADRHEQWLQRIPDNPAGLLQRKFQHEHRQRQRSSDSKETDELW